MYFIFSLSRDLRGYNFKSDGSFFMNITTYFEWSEPNENNNKITDCDNFKSTHSFREILPLT